MKFIVDRSNWRSGGDDGHTTGVGETRLKNKEGFMCCLGFCAQQLGVDDEKLYVYEPSEVEFEGMKSNPLANWWDEFGGYDNSKLSSCAISINDNGDITQREREKKLRELFKKHGHEIFFKGDIW